jgi:hypothetical protein
VIIGVLVEQLIFGVFYLIQSPEGNISSKVFYVTLIQVFLAGVISPVIFVIFKKIFDVSDKLSFQDDKRG